MSGKSLQSVALLAAAMLAGACQEGAITEPEAGADLALAAAVEAAGDAAVQAGDTERADALRHGAHALRWGIRPSRIEVQIHNETFEYLAIVVGVVRERGGERFLVRQLVAWDGRPPKALLNVTSKSEQALFGHPGDNGQGNNDTPGAARGIWRDLANHEVWVATAGSAELELLGTGGDCPRQPAAIALRCALAAWDVRVNGTFQLIGEGGPGGQPVQIHTSADGVRGVVIKPAN